MRRLGLVSVVLIAGLVAGAGSGAPPAQSTMRILYASDWTGPMEIFAVDPSGRGRVRQVTFGQEEGCVDDVLSCGFDGPIPSPDGWHIVFRAAHGPDQYPYPSLWVAGASGGHPHRLAQSVGDFPGGAAWSPDSTRIAYSAPDGAHVVRADGSGDRLILADVHVSDVAWSPDGSALAVQAYRLYLIRGGRTTDLGGPAGALAWSPDGRWIATYSTNGCCVSFVRASPRTAGPEPRLNVEGVLALAWSPNSRLLAVEGTDGLSVVDVRTGRARLLTRDTAHQSPDQTWDQAPRGLAWSPDGRSIAYVAGYFLRGLPFGRGDLRTVTLSGRVRTIVAASRAYGGRIVSVAWARPAAATRYRSPTPAPLRTVAANSLLADGPVYRLAADGARVAYLACHGVSVWTTRAKTVVEVEKNQYACLPPSSRDQIVDVAIAGDRVAWAEKTAGLEFRWTVSAAGLTPTTAIVTLATGYADLGDPFGTGTLAGASTLLVDSSWDYNRSKHAATTQSVNRVDVGGCPCPAIATSPGPLTPFDVDSGRVVAGGDNETLVLDGHGTQLLSVPVSPVAAQLSGRSLILLRPGELLEYDTGTGALLHRRQLPDVTSGRDCDLYDDPACPLRRPSLRLEDAARGLVVYVLDNQVHLLRVSDGADVVVAAGTLARFMDAGLVYADGARLHLIPFDGLPLK